MVSRVMATILVMVLAAGLVACGSDKSAKRMKNPGTPAVLTEAPAPEELMSKAVVVVVDQSGTIFIHGEPLGEGEDLEFAIRKAYTKKRNNWPLTVYIDPSQKDRLLLPVFEAASEVRPGYVNVITQPVDYSSEGEVG